MSKELQKKYHEALQNVTRERNQLRRELEFAKSIIRILQAKGDAQWNKQNNNKYIKMLAYQKA
jgi:histone deacetylase complex regulatory component SIN3